jgi:hypothetical protein
MKDLLLTAPDSQLDDSAKPFIRDWSEPPTALQILRVLDHCTYTGGASGFVMTALDILLQEALVREGTTLKAIAPQATWRTETP